MKPEVFVKSDRKVFFVGGLWPCRLIVIKCIKR